MNVMKKFEEHLEYLGFDLAPVAWDLAHMNFASDEDRIALVQQLSGEGTNGEATPQ